MLAVGQPVAARSATGLAGQPESGTTAAQAAATSRIARHEGRWVDAVLLRMDFMSLPPVNGAHCICDDHRRSPGFCEIVSQRGGDGLAGCGEFHLLGGLFDEGLEAGAATGLVESGGADDDQLLRVAKTLGVDGRSAADHADG